MKNVILYHGTDARILRMTNEERKSYKKECIEAIDYMWTFWKPYAHNNFQDIKSLWWMEKKCNLNKAFWHADTCNELRIAGSEEYQYKYIYLSDNLDKAKNYAYMSFAFGEIGFIAYIFYEVTKKVGFPEWNPDEHISNILKKIQVFAEETPQPIVVQIDSFDEKQLETDKGEVIDWNYADILLDMCRYTGELDLNNFTVINLDLLKPIKDWDDEPFKPNITPKENNHTSYFYKTYHYHINYSVIDGKKSLEIGQNSADITIGLSKMETFEFEEGVKLGLDVDHVIRLMFKKIHQAVKEDLQSKYQDYPWYGLHINYKQEVPQLCNMVKEKAYIPW